MSTMELLYEKLKMKNLWRDFSLKRHEFLLYSGKTDTNLYFVEQGSLRIFIEYKEEEQCIRFGYRNSFLTALDSFITTKPSVLNIQALKKSKLKMINKNDYLDFIQESPVNLQLWSHLLEQLVYQQFEREIDLLTTSAVERYKRVLHRSPQLFQEIPNKYIASYLRMAPETLSRIQKS